MSRIKSQFQKNIKSTMINSSLKKVSLASLATLVLFASGCRIKNGTEASPIEKERQVLPVPSPSPSSDPTLLPKDESQWDESVENTEAYELKSKTLKLTLLEKIKKRFSVPVLEKVQIPSTHFQLYTIKGDSSPIKTVYVLPKIFVHGTAQGGNVLQVGSKDDKTLFITFPIAIVDGLINNLTAYEGQSSVKLPDEFQIININDVRETLKAKFGKEVELGSLPICPKQMKLIQLKGGEKKEYPLRLTWGTEDSCTLNEFFTVTLSGPKSEMLGLIQETLSGGLGVQLGVGFQITYSEPISYFEIKLKPDYLFQVISNLLAKENTKEEHLYLAHELISVFMTLLKETFGKYNSVKTPEIPFSKWVPVLIDHFFQRSNDPSCLPPNQCYVLKPQAEIQKNQWVEFQWLDHELLGVSDVIPNQVFLQGLAESFPLQMPGDRAMSFFTEKPLLQSCMMNQDRIPGCPGFSCEKFPDNVYCRLPQSKATIHQFQVFPGSQIRINVQRITEWTHELPIPREDSTPEQKKGSLKCADSRVVEGACVEYEEVCAAPEVSFCPLPKEVCVEDRGIYDEQCQTETQMSRDCGFLGLGICHFNLKETKKTCSKVQVGKECLIWNTECQMELKRICPKTERKCKTPALTCEQYTTEFYSRYTYSEPWVRPKVLDLAKGETIEQLWDGLDVEVSWLAQDGKTWKSITCPLKAFRHELSGTTLTFELANQPGTSCMPFNEWNIQEGRWPTLSIINHISFNRPYLCGSLDWTHTISADSKSKC